ncbi:hypothetical protein [Streptomyces termitum]|uniref:hypothetical protein n=1 Tax=Streptomyces termitum TaxID=67368 RepID=UPI00379D6014
MAEAARRLAAEGRGLELAAIPADGSLVPAGDRPELPVHPTLEAALAAHRGGGEEQREWRSDAWPGEAAGVRGTGGSRN